MVVYYTQDASASYEDIQICDKNWKGLAFSVEGNNFTGDFSPRDYYGFTGENCNTPMIFTGQAFASVKQGGLIIQGFGATLTKIVFVSSEMMAVQQVTTGDDTSTSPIYNLSGQRIYHPFPGTVVIRNGKKIIYKPN